MDYQLLSLFNESEARDFQTQIEALPAGDGTSTAAGHAKRLKHNLQLQPGGPTDALAQRIVDRLVANTEFQAFALPKRILPPLFALYDAGMSYGEHVDAAIMAAPGGPLRTDLAMTLFLTPPQDYEGGELVLRLAAGEEEIKLMAGEAVIYSADTLHRVAPVRSGRRVVAVTWMQSAVRDPRLRNILCNLGTLSTEFKDDGNLGLRLSHAYHNLLRYSADI